MSVYLFPGQGSQKKFIDKFLLKKFKNFLEISENIIGYSIDEVFSNEYYYSQTKYIQPIIYITNSLNYLNQINISDITPNYLIGHSLGEYNALLAAGVFDFETGLIIVKKRAELMNQLKNGGMAAIIGLSFEEIQNILKKENFLKEIEISNLNSYQQIVISGPKEKIISSENLFKKYGALAFINLNVSGAFHSSYMKPILDEYQEFLKKFEFKEPLIPVISNFEAYFYNKNNVINLLIEHLIKPVKWVKIIEFLISKNENKFIEIGSSNLLINMINNIKNGR